MSPDKRPFLFKPLRIVLDTYDYYLLDVGQKENIFFPKPLAYQRGNLFVVPTWFAELKKITHMRVAQ